MTKDKIKTLNVLNAIICIAWFLSFISNIINIASTNASYELMYKNLIANSRYYNSAISVASYDNDSNENPLFSDGKTAFITAWDNFKNASSYEMIGSGNGRGSADIPVIGKQSQDLKTQYHIVKWETGEHQYEYVQKQVSNFIIGEVSTSVTYQFSDGINEGRFEKKADKEDTKIVGDEIVINYKEDYSYKKNQDVYKYLYYTVNDSTIVKDTFFRVNKNIVGKIESYSCSIVLNAARAGKDFAQFFFDISGDVLSVPVMDKVEFDCLIDTNGNFITLVVHEAYHFMGKSGEFQAVTYWESTNTFQFSSINKPIEFEKPSFEVK